MEMERDDDDPMDLLGVRFGASTTAGPRSACRRAVAREPQVFMPLIFPTTSFQTNVLSNIKQISFRTFFLLIPLAAVVSSHFFIFVFIFCCVFSAFCKFFNSSGWTFINNTVRNDLDISGLVVCIYRNACSE